MFKENLHKNLEIYCCFKKTTKKPLLATSKQHKEMSADSDVLHSIVTIKKKIVF